MIHCYGYNVIHLTNSYRSESTEPGPTISTVPDWAAVNRLRFLFDI